MLTFYFWVLEGHPLHKKFRAPRTSRFGDMGVKGSTFPPLLPKLGGQIPSILCIGYTRDDLQKPWKFCESLANSFRDFRLFAVRAYRRDTIVSSTLKAESLYSDKYSFTTMSHCQVMVSCMALQPHTAIFGGRHSDWSALRPWLTARANIYTRHVLSRYFLHRPARSGHIGLRSLSPAKMVGRVGYRPHQVTAQQMLCQATIAQSAIVACSIYCRLKTGRVGPVFRLLGSQADQAGPSLIFSGWQWAEPGWGGSNEDGSVQKSGPVQTSTKNCKRESKRPTKWYHIRIFSGFCKALTLTSLKNFKTQFACTIL